MKPHLQRIQILRLVGLILSSIVATSTALRAQTAPAPASTTASDQRASTVAPATAAPRSDTRAEAVVMSPFEVTADNKGYFAANTMSGTRFNTKVEDLGSSLTVMTKEQMADFAMVD